MSQLVDLDYALIEPCPSPSFRGKLTKAVSFIRDTKDVFFNDLLDDYLKENTPRGGVAAYSEFDQNKIVIKVCTDPDLSYMELVMHIVHELIHYKQLNEGQLIVNYEPTATVLQKQLDCFFLEVEAYSAEAMFRNSYLNANLNRQYYCKDIPRELQDEATYNLTEFKTEKLEDDFRKEVTDRIKENEGSRSFASLSV